MFDLNKNISNWKLSLSNNESFTRENIDELKSHLNDQISALKDAGLNDEEAFWVAQKRIGTIDSLNSEFSKINKLNILKKKIYWMLTGIAGMLMYIFFVTSSYYIFISICMLLNFDPITFILINNSFNEIIIISVCLLILWIMTSKKSKLIDKYFFNKLDKINKSKFSIIIILTFVISSVVYFYFTYKLNTDINRWIVNSESYSDFKEINKFLNPLQFVFNSVIILYIYYISFKTKKKIDIISN